MKSNKVIYLSLLILFITSCSKEQSSFTKDQISESDQKLSSLVKEFKARGESGLKSGTEMDIETAVWYLGVTANYTYGDASRETERTWTDTFFITLPVSNGKVSESDVYNKYEALIENLRSLYQAKNEENKQLIAVEVITHSLEAENLVCKVTAIFAFDGPTPVTCTFNDIDSYCYSYYWQYHPICDGPNIGSIEVTDAAEETQKRIMRCKGVPMGNYYYSHEETIPIPDPTIFPVNPNIGTPRSNYRYAKLYWNSTEYSGFDGCIPPADLNFYLTKTKELIYNHSENGGICPPNKSLISIDMWGRQKYDEQNFLIYEHNANVTYGILHVSPDPKENL